MNSPRSKILTLVSLAALLLFPWVAALFGMVVDGVGWLSGGAHMWIAMGMMSLGLMCLTRICLLSCFSGLVTRRIEVGGLVAGVCGLGGCW